MTLPAGSKLGPYKIVALLGAGGMGEVYRARDERLDRDVAVKVLPAGALADESDRKQFRREALALSKLSHPNIAMIFDVGSADGVDFIVLELVPGKTLAERLSEGSLSEREILILGEQVAEGLAAAHKQGLLHRDVKPANLRVTPEGRLKILDFGLAKLMRTHSGSALTESLTESGRVAGTLPYMPPEQLRGERVDERADIYAAGAVLYEMATGRRAFPQQTAALAIQAILNEVPTPPREARPELSTHLESVLLRCLEKDPRHRYQSARDLADDLKRTDPGAGARHLAARAAQRWGRLPLVGAIAVATVLAATLALESDLGGIRQYVFGRGTSKTSNSIAVLPLANLSGDPGQEYFADGMTDEIIMRLAQVSALRVISRTSTMEFKGAKKSLARIANELHVAMVVEGSVARVGDRVRISARLVEARTDRGLWAESYEREVGDILALQSDVAQAIVQRVQVRLTPRERGRLAVVRAVDPEAHEAYLHGLAFLHRYDNDGLHRAIEKFQRATEIQPDYAQAWAEMSAAYYGLSSVYLPSNEAMPRSRAAATKALEIDPHFAAARAMVAATKMTYDADFVSAEKEFKEALIDGAGDATVHQNYAILLIALGRTDEALGEIERAREIDPLSRVLASMSLWPLFEGHRFREAASTARQILEADPRVQYAWMILGQADIFLGETSKAIVEIRKAIELDPGNPFPIGWLGYAYGTAGRRAEARAVLARLDNIGKKQYVQPYTFAIVHIGLGEKEEALRWLSRAVDAHADELVFVRVDPALDSLRSDSRFKDLLARLGPPT